ncbi:hypothetical protein GB937_007911 [Aspergillus fischeri]|nr:hypothetical protein GB937_007911 [Aspergillus fischeri]
MYEIGAGMAIQLPVTAVQATVAPLDLPSAMAIVLFFQMDFVSVARRQSSITACCATGPSEC